MQNLKIMKRNFLKGIAAIGLVLVAGITAQAQMAINNVEFSNVDPSTSVTKSDYFKSKATKDLARQFKNASSKNWFNIPEGYYVNFKADDVDYMVFYDKKGNWRYTIRNYDEAKLTADIRHIVRSTYYDHNVRLVQEIQSAGNNITYLIHLEGKTNWINLRVANGEMDEFQKYSKSE